LNISVEAANLSNWRIESKKIDSVARIESKLFCPNWNALLRSTAAWFAVAHAGTDRQTDVQQMHRAAILCQQCQYKSPNLITERRVPELIPVLGSQPAGDVNHKAGGRLPLLSARPAVTPTTLKSAATNFAAW